MPTWLTPVLALVGSVIGSLVVAGLAIGERQVSAIDLALPRIETEEGFRSLAYKDSRAKLTIGYGFCVDAGISKYAAAALLRAQLAELEAVLTSYTWYQVANDVRKSVFLDIAFNSGAAGLLHFPHMLAAAAQNDWATAASECKVIEPELAGRYAALAKLLLEG